MSKKFAKVPNVSVWEPCTFDFLESVILQIEGRFGRRQLNSFDESGTDGSFIDKKADMLRRIEDGDHFKESPKFNFANLPDPFGSYLQRINPEEIDQSVAGDISAADKGLDHIEDPGHKSLMEREIQR